MAERTELSEFLDQYEAYFDGETRALPVLGEKRCSHSRNGNPSQCSQCLGAKVCRVELTDSAILVDGQPQPERPSQPFAGRRVSPR